jgi:hypothetical protein
VSQVGLSAYRFESSRENTVWTPDGRMLGVEQAGDPAGRPVLAHMAHPTPADLIWLVMVAGCPAASLRSFSSAA